MPGKPGLNVTPRTLRRSEVGRDPWDKRGATESLSSSPLPGGAWPQASVSFEFSPPLKQSCLGKGWVSLADQVWLREFTLEVRCATCQLLSH